MTLGSHNSMTYLPPKHWWMWPFIPMARCQTKTIEEQYSLGSRWFDIRVRFDSDGNLLIAHGYLVFKGDEATIQDTLLWLNERAVLEKQKVMVRFIYELNKEDKSSHAKENEQRFVEFCERQKNEFPDITFLGGRRKYDWKELYQFGNQEPEYLDLYSSMTWTILDDLLPVFYAVIMNNRNYRKYKGQDVLMLVDFIHFIRQD